MEKEELKDAIKEVLHAEIKPFYIEREMHYQDHQFIKEVREFIGSIKSTTSRTVVGIVVTALIGLVVLGFILWSKKHIGP